MRWRSQLRTSDWYPADQLVVVRWIAGRDGADNEFPVAALHGRATPVVLAGLARLAEFPQPQVGDADQERQRTDGQQRTRGVVLADQRPKGR